MAGNCIPFTFVFLVALLLSACGPTLNTVEQHIAEGNYAAAVTSGNEILRKDPQSPDAPKVRQAIMEADFLAASKADTLEAYDRFESKYPESGHSREISELKSKKYYETVTRPANSIAAHREFQSRFPASSLIEQSRRQEQVLAWEEAQRTNSPESYKAFAERYPESPMAVKAREQEQTQAWAATLKANSVAAYKAYVGQYQNSANSAEAWKRLCAMAYTEAEQAGTAARLKTFRDDYPQCTEQARAASDKEMLAAWAETVRLNTWEGYRSFRERYPTSKHVKEAAEKEHLLWLFAGPAGKNEYSTSITSRDDSDPGNIGLFVQVTGEDGKAVGGLPASSFSLYENGCEAKIRNFEGMESERPVDVVFILDTTGSMGKEIAGVKNAVVQFVENLRLGNRNARLALIPFGDEVRGVYKSNADARQFQNWVAAQTAEGGSGDDSENALEALNAALNLNFRSNAQRVFILITDAPFHEHDASTPLTIAGIADRLRSGRVQFVSISPDSKQFRQLVEGANGRLHNLFRVKNYNELFESISVMAAKQYLLTYADSGCRSGKGERTVRVRARKEFIWAPTGRPEAKDVADIVVDPGSPEVSYIATRDAGLFKSADNGATWLPIGTDLPESSFESIMPVSSQGGKLLARSRTGRIYLSRDFGVTWKPGNAPQAFISLINMPNKPDAVYATEGQHLFSSADGGETWQTISQIAATRTSIALAVDPARNGIVALGKGEDAKFSEDGGGTWLPMDLKSPEQKTDLADYRFYRPQNLAGAMYMFKPGGNLYRSMDSGSSWENITPATAGGALVRDVRFDPTDRQMIIATTTQGVYSSSDGGASWLPFGEGMDTWDAVDSVVAFAPNGNIEVAGKKSGKVYNLHSIKDREFISGNVYFATGSAAINESLHGYLNQLARRLAENGSLGVRIEGHTDDVGKDELNKRLSLQRAGSVMEYLVSRGIAPKRIVTAGYGKNRPIVPNVTPENRAKNRRVELTLIGK